MSINSFFNFRNPKSHEPLSDKALYKSFYTALLMAVFLPPFIGGTVMGLVGFYPLPEFYLIFMSYSGLYVFFVSALVLAISASWCEKIIELAENPDSTSIKRAKDLFTRIPVYLVICITVYSVGGALSADFSLESMGISEYTIEQHLINQLGIIPVILITTFPIFFYFVDRLGRYLGPRGIYISAVPLWLKLLMLGIVTPVIIDSIVVGYFYNRTGYFEIETLILWVSLMLVAIVSTWLAWSSLYQSIAPLEQYVSTLPEATFEKIAGKLKPLSLDELGILTAQFSLLLVDQERLSKNLKQERDFATTLLETAPMIALLLDTDGRIKYVNDYFEQISGYQLSEIKDKDWFSLFIPPEDKQPISQIFQDAAQAKHTRGNINPIIIKGGEYRYIEWNDQTIHDEDNTVTGVLAVGLDITERQHIDNELAEYRNNLEQIINERTKELDNAQYELVRKERLATLGQLTATVSHELRNPLAAIRPALYTINKNIDKGDEKMQNAIVRVVRNVERCDRIIDELLDFTRIRALDKESILLDNWLDSVINEQALPKEITIEKDLTLKNKRIEFDSECMRRVIINVLDNAKHSMMDENKNIINVQDASIVIKTREKDDNVEISITDNGCGIAKNALNKIFEPLYSTKTFGIGLGMPTIRQIMQQHSGDIKVRSKINSGTQITLWFPLISSTNNSETVAAHE